MNRVFARASVAAVALCVALLAAAPSVAKDVPFLTGRVNDYANMISPEAEARIASKAKQFEQETGTQIVVLTIASLDGDSLEDFAVRAYNTWRLGRRDQNDGALLLIVRDDRKTRIETGYGVEASLTDAKSRRILVEILRPKFRAKDFDGGVEASVDAMIDVAKGGELPPPAPNDTDYPGDDMFAVIWFAMLSPFIWMTIMTGPMGWFLYLFLIPFVYAGGATAGGHSLGVTFVVIWLILIPVLWYLTRNRRKKWMKRRKSRWSSSRGWGSSSGGWSSGGWSSGGSSSGGWSSGGGGWSSGGGGFSGGGGMSGGGGASSSW